MEEKKRKKVESADQPSSFQDSGYLPIAERRREGREQGGREMDLSLPAAL